MLLYIRGRIVGLDLEQEVWGGSRLFEGFLSRFPPLYKAVVSAWRGSALWDRACLA